MKNSDGSRRPRSLFIICVVITLVSVPLLLHARTFSTSVQIVNNSSGEIRNVYTSPVDNDNWSADLLGDASIGAGQSYTIGDVACTGDQTKVIAEDQDGCFLYKVVTCGQSTTWTVTNDTTRDCGY